MAKRAGIDEVGRGSFAGPAFVCVCCIQGDENDVQVELERVTGKVMTDSKHLTKRQRERAFAFLKSVASYSLGQASPREIDDLGLTTALTLAADRAVQGLLGMGCEVVEIYADAGLSTSLRIPTTSFVRGDEQYLEIAAASIIAKVSRDALMAELSREYPLYGWDQNAGYGSAGHRASIQKYGLTPHHRRSFIH